MGLYQHCLCISLYVQKEGDRSSNGSQLQELAISYLWLDLFGHFHSFWYFTSYAIEMQYLIHLKTEAQLPGGTFVCKHQFVVWNSVLSEHFDEQAVICTGKSGMRRVAFSLEKVGQLISCYHIFGKLEHVYPKKKTTKKPKQKQHDNSEKDNGSTHIKHRSLYHRIGSGSSKS